MIYNVYPRKAQYTVVSVGRITYRIKLQYNLGQVCSKVKA